MRHFRAPAWPPPLALLAAARRRVVAALSIDDAGADDKAPIKLPGTGDSGVVCPATPSTPWPTANPGSRGPEAATGDR